MLAAAAALVAGSVRAAPAASPETDVRAAFARYDEGWRTYDVEKVVDAFADDFGIAVTVRLIDRPPSPR